MKIRKKPIVVEAWVIDTLEMQYNGEMPSWVYSAWKEDKVIGLISDGHDLLLRIKTMEGIMTAKNRDILVRGVKNELYAINRAIFEETYDLVEDEDDRKQEDGKEAVKSAVDEFGISMAEFTDLPDGSAMCAVHMPYETLVTFARIGMMRAIEDACDRAEELDPDA